MTKQTFQATNSLIKQTPSSYFKSNPKIQCSDNSFKVKPTKLLSVCGGRGLRPDPSSPTGVYLLLLLFLVLSSKDIVKVTRCLLYDAVVYFCSEKQRWQVNFSKQLMKNSLDFDFFKNKIIYLICNDGSTAEFEKDKCARCVITCVSYVKKTSHNRFTPVLNKALQEFQKQLN